MARQQNRTDKQRHRAQIKAANRARYKAVQWLISEHQDEFDAAYAAFGAAETPPVAPGQHRGYHESSEQRAARLRLAEVAQVYTANIDGYPTKAVQEALGLASRGAAKHRVEAARKAGLLPPTEMRRKRV